MGTARALSAWHLPKDRGCAGGGGGVRKAFLMFGAPVLTFSSVLGEQTHVQDARGPH